MDSFLRALARLPTAPLDRRELEQALHDAHFERFSEVTRGRYELEALLGAGGMGVVYAANNVRTQRAVAIKFLHPRPHEPAALQRERALRFAREASAAGRIHHPNVVDIYDVESEVATPYLVMERLVGESLRQRIARAPLSPLAAVTILTEAMRGVVEAHDHGVVHRDLKPDNIFLARQRDRDSPVAKVLDFGVSRLLERDGTARPSALTGVGHLLGTPAYMPLEQLRGDPDCDGRVDVYALGVTLYEAICGQRPWSAPSDGSPAERGAEAVPLAARCPEVDGELSAIVMQAMSSERSERYATVRAFALALEGWLARTARVDAEPAFKRPSTRGGRRKARFVALGIVALALMVLATWLARHPAQPQGDRGEQRAHSVEASERRSDLAASRAARRAVEAPLARPPQEASEAAGSHAPAGDVARAAERAEIAPASVEARGLARERRVEARDLAPGRRAEALRAAGARNELPSAGRVTQRKRHARPTDAHGRAPRDIENPSPMTDPKRAVELHSSEF